MDVDVILNELGRRPNLPCDLAEIALRLACDEYPSLDVEAHLSELAGMAHEAGNYVRGSLEARVHGLCRYLFHEMGFHGNVQHYHDARNSYLNQVMDRRTGIPITMSLVAMSVGQRTGLNLVGVGLPGHFIVKATDDGEEHLFDPFHGGRPLCAQDCENLVLQVTRTQFTATPENLRAMPNARIVLRLLTNLKHIYMQQGDAARAIRTIGRMRMIVPADPMLRRDLGACLIHAGRPGQAIDHLQTYLRACPQNSDRERVASMLRHAEELVSRWN